MAVQLIRQKQMNKTISRLPGVKASVRAVADEIGVIANARLLPHRKTGAAHIEVKSGRVDSWVSLVDEAALSIEFGHYLGREELGTGRKFIQGLHLFIDWYHEGVL